MAKRKQYDVEIRPGESAISYYKRLAKVADQRLVRIEKLSGLRGGEPDPEYGNAFKYAYRKAMESLPDDQMRFNAAIPPVGSEAFKKRMVAMKKFLNAATSTKQGMSVVYKKQISALNSKFGTNFTPDQLTDFVERGDFDKLKKDYGSATIFTAIGRIDSIREDLKNGLEDHIKNNMKSDPADEVALSILRRTSLNVYKNMSKEERKKIRKIIRSL